MDMDGDGICDSNNTLASGNVDYLPLTLPTITGTNLHLSKQAPVSKDNRSTMTYSLYYHNFGDTAAQDVVLEDTLPAEVEFVSASDSGSYDTGTGKVTWNLGSLESRGHGYENVTVRISQNTTIGIVIQNDANISTSTTEVRYDDNEAQAQTRVIDSSLPPDAGVEPNNGGDTLSVYWNTPTTFSYQNPNATGVDIRIQVDDGGSDITGSMTGGPLFNSSLGNLDKTSSDITGSITGGPPEWTFTITLYPRHGRATITYTVYTVSGEESSVPFNIYIDPAGYIYDVDTGERIANATVWLQRPDGLGGWENVPTGEVIPIAQPDKNPLITGADGQYQWDVLAGSYRVHVEASGYYPEDSIVVSIPPPVTDLHVGLTRIPTTTTTTTTSSTTSTTTSTTTTTTTTSTTTTTTTTVPTTTTTSTTTTTTVPTTTTTSTTTTTTTTQRHHRHSGGGGGGMPTSHTHRIKDVSKGGMFSLDIDDKDILYINGLSLTTKQDVYSSRLSITDLDKKPYYSMAEPDATVFRYFKVRYDKKNYVENASFNFRVNTSWLEDGNISQDTVRMYRYTTTWKELDTEFIKEDDNQG